MEDKKGLLASFAEQLDKYNDERFEQIKSLLNELLERVSGLEVRLDNYLKSSSEISENGNEHAFYEQMGVGGDVEEGEDAYSEEEAEEEFDAEGDGDAFMFMNEEKEAVEAGCDDAADAEDGENDEEAEGGEEYEDGEEYAEEGEESMDDNEEEESVVEEEGGEEYEDGEEVVSDGEESAEEENDVEYDEEEEESEEFAGEGDDEYANEEEEAEGEGYEDEMVGEDEESAEEEEPDWYDWEVDYPQGEVEDLVAAMGINDKMQFIGDLFSADSELFTETMAAVESCGSFKEAKAYLMESFPEWNFRGDLVYNFMMHLRRKFR